MGMFIKTENDMAKKEEPQTKHQVEYITRKWTQHHSESLFIYNHLASEFMEKYDFHIAQESQIKEKLLIKEQNSQNEPKAIDIKHPISAPVKPTLTTQSKQIQKTGNEELATTLLRENINNVEENKKTFKGSRKGRSRSSEKPKRTHSINDKLQKALRKKEKREIENLKKKKAEEEKRKKEEEIKKKKAEEEKRKKEEEEERKKEEEKDYNAQIVNFEKTAKEITGVFYIYTFGAPCGMCLRNYQYLLRLFPKVKFYLYFSNQKNAFPDYLKYEGRLKLNQIFTHSQYKDLFTIL